jgi:hypothetical protein
MRRFHFNRVEDAKTDKTVGEGGVSAVGRVAEGVLFDNGLIALTWNSMHKCVNVYTSYAEMTMVHGHEGKTVVVWVDPDPNAIEEPEPEPAPKKAKRKTTKK